jgi:hypothetical protein
VPPHRIGFTASNGEAKRKIAEGALWLDDQAVTDPGAPAVPGKLRLGKKKTRRPARVLTPSFTLYPAFPAIGVPSN